MKSSTISWGIPFRCTKRLANEVVQNGNLLLYVIEELRKIDPQSHSDLYRDAVDDILRGSDQSPPKGLRNVKMTENQVLKL